MPKDRKLITKQKPSFVYKLDNNKPELLGDPLKVTVTFILKPTASLEDAQNTEHFMELAEDLEDCMKDWLSDFEDNDYVVSYSGGSIKIEKI
ncbi:MAG: hypothetical protein WC346_21825 [Methanogenium sp.]|jgi:hypothetical protein